MTNAEAIYLKWMCVVGLGVYIALTWGCAGQTPRKSLKAAHEIIHDFDQRTSRLCLGAAPVKSKGECLNRVETSERAQRAVNVAQQAVLSCTTDPCPAAELAITAAEAALIELESYVFKGGD